MQFETIDEGRSHKRVMRIDDEEVCHLWVIDYTMRIGTAEVRMAGIGDVYTNREHRMKGYMRHLYGDTLKYMTGEGYDVSMLFGIPNFYTKFGYASSMPSVKFTIKTRDAEVAGEEAARKGGAIATRAIESSDMDAVIELYNRKNASRTGSLVRDPAHFMAFNKGTHWGTQAETALWEDQDGTLLGYAVWDKSPTEVKIAEVETESVDLYPAILTAFAQQAIAKRCEQITCFLPRDHGFSDYAQRFGIVWTAEYPRYSDCMMRIMNQQPLMQKLAPVFNARKDRLPAHESLDALRIETDLGITTVLYGDTTEALAGDQQPGTHGVSLELPQDTLIQLIMGYRSIQDVLTAPNVKLDPGDTEEQNVVSFLQGLFPRHDAFVWKPDYF